MILLRMTFIFIEDISGWAKLKFVAGLFGFLGYFLDGSPVNNAFMYSLLWQSINNCVFRTFSLFFMDCVSALCFTETDAQYVSCPGDDEYISEGHLPCGSQSRTVQVVNTTWGQHDNAVIYQGWEICLLKMYL